MTYKCGPVVIGGTRLIEWGCALRRESKRTKGSRAPRGAGVSHTIRARRALRSRNQHMGRTMYKSV